jgi:hypothetical protein
MLGREGAASAHSEQTGESWESMALEVMMIVFEFLHSSSLRLCVLFASLRETLQFACDHTPFPTANLPGRRRTKSGETDKVRL